ncbi:PREDICTED: C-type lectin domain family 7 member A isoform X4 [Galeopterus variegatus]|uniref:C-type lectin domain family 7 member A isoform X4 n=1 Tax=Galeopterus variegatus TaxID=482537 RepID=A0ABM0R6P8_GALVR|nr:PREDICTED: C-type lectin domain family 7 member A isoform X4 [Galeopterus variegatus]
MAYRSDLEQLDEDGYTQLDFNSRRPVGSKKGTCATFPWRLIAVILGVLCLVILVIAVVLGTITGFKAVKFEG